jgi:hypothetical protein
MILSQKVGHGSAMGGSAEYMREAMASLESTGVGLSQITSEVGVGMKILGDRGGNCFKGRIRPFVGHDRLPDSAASCKKSVANFAKEVCEVRLYCEEPGDWAGGLLST